MENKVSRTSLRKSYDGKINTLITGIAVTWMLFQIFIAAQFIFLAPHRVRIIHLGFALVMIFLLTPISRKDNLKKLSIFDIALALTVAGVFIASYLRFGVIIRLGGRIEMIDVYLGVAIILLLYEGARRVVSPALLCLSLVMLLYVFFGDRLDGPLGHTGFTITRVVRHLCSGGEGIFGFALGVTAEIIVMFVLFGSILQEVGIGDYFFDLSNAITGRQKGGPAKVVVVSSALMGTVTGETSANVATTGPFTIPMMKRVGYDKNFAGAVECSASAGGQILPPIMGATAFMMADTLGIPYLTIATAAVLPAILYFTSVYFVVHFRAISHDLKGIEDGKPDWLNLLKRSYLMLPLAGIVILLVNRYTPTFSAFWGGIVPAVIISFFFFNLLAMGIRELRVES
jgi:TRAP transporter 4TM/12TM fusion protein